MAERGLDESLTLTLPGCTILAREARMVHHDRARCGRRADEFRIRTGSLLAWALLEPLPEDLMSAVDLTAIVSWPASNEEAEPRQSLPARFASRLDRSQIIDATTRLIARRGDHRIPWPAIAVEAGGEPFGIAPDWLDDLPALIDECYARTAQALADSLLRAETAPGNALDKLAAFLVAALEARREHGTLLSFRRGRNLPDPLQRRLHERDMMVRTRLKRLLEQGRRDGSLARRNPDSACELILASLMVPDVAVTDPEQLIWDSELVELLLAALAEPHPIETPV